MAPMRTPPLTKARGRQPNNNNKRKDSCEDKDKENRSRSRSNLRRSSTTEEEIGCQEEPYYCLPSSNLRRPTSTSTNTAKSWKPTRMRSWVQPGYSLTCCVTSRCPSCLDRTLSSTHSASPLRTAKTCPSLLPTKPLSNLMLPEVTPPVA